MNYIGIIIIGMIFLSAAFRLVRSICMVPNQKKYVVERLGKYHTTLSPGLHVLIPYIDRVVAIQDLKEQSIEVPPQECFTKDNVKVEVDGVLYISVEDVEKATYGITDYRMASILLAQTTTRSVIGVLELDRTFEERDAINSRVVSVLDEVGDSWGIRVHRYEIKNIVTPTTVRVAMERQMSAEREKRAVLARSEGEKMSMINKSEGLRMEMINQSEGEKQRRINKASGRAEEILSISEATAESIRKIGNALTYPGASEAMRFRLSRDYLSQMRKLGKKDTKILLPANIADINSLLKSIGLDSEKAEQQAELLKKEAKRVPKHVRQEMLVPAARTEINRERPLDSIIFDD